MFELGSIVTTKGVDDKITEGKEKDDFDFLLFVRLSLTRHASGDWGDLGSEDKQTNEDAVKGGDRLFSAYEGDNMPKIWIITEGDRSVTTVLFPSEY